MAQNSNYVTVDGEFDSLEKRSFLTIDDYNLENQTIILRIDINDNDKNYITKCLNFNRYSLWFRNIKFGKHVLTCACCITVLLSICEIILAGILSILRIVLCSNICKRA